MLNNLKKLLLKKNQIKLTTSILLPTIIFGFVLQSCDKNFKLFSNIKPFTEKEYIEKKNSLLKTFKNEFLKKIRDTEDSIFKKYIKNIEEENRFLSSLGEENKKNIENLNNNETLEKLITNFYNPNENVEYYTTKELKEIFDKKNTDKYNEIFIKKSIRNKNEHEQFIYENRNATSSQEEISKDTTTFKILGKNKYTFTIKTPKDVNTEQTIEIINIQKNKERKEGLSGYSVALTLNKKDIRIIMPEEVKQNFDWQETYKENSLFWFLKNNMQKKYDGRNGKTKIEKYKGDGFVIPGQLNILKNFFFKGKTLLVKKELIDNTKSLNEQLHFFKTLSKLSNLKDNKEELKKYIDNKKDNNFDLAKFNALIAKLFLTNVVETITYENNGTSKTIKLLKNDEVKLLKNLYYFINSWNTIGKDTSEKNKIIINLKTLLLKKYFDTEEPTKDLWKSPSPKIDWNIESDTTKNKHTSTIKDKDIIFYSSKIEVKEDKSFIVNDNIRYIINDDLSAVYYQTITDTTKIKSENKTDEGKDLSSFYSDDKEKTELLNSNPWMLKLFVDKNKVKYNTNELLKNYILLMTILKKENASKEIFNFLKPEYENIIKSIPESILKPIIIYLLFKRDSNENIKLTDITNNLIYKKIKDLETITSNLELYKQELLLLLYNFLINRKINVKLENITIVYNSEEKLLNKDKENFYQFFEFNNLWKSFYKKELEQSKNDDVKKIIKKIINDNKDSFDNTITDKVDLLKLRDNGFISNFGLFNILKDFKENDNTIKLEHLTNKTKIKVYKIYYLSQLLWNNKKSTSLNNKNIKESFINVFKLKLSDPTYYENKENVKNFYYWYEKILNKEQQNLFKKTYDHLTKNFEYTISVEEDYKNFIINFIKDNLDKKEGLIVLLFKHLFKKTKVKITKTKIESKQKNKENWKKLFNQYIKFL